MLERRQGGEGTDGLGYSGNDQYDDGSVNATLLLVAVMKLIELIS
jgi:hypothetical protein